MCIFLFSTVNFSVGRAPLLPPPYPIYSDLYFAVETGSEWDSSGLRKMAPVCLRSLCSSVFLSLFQSLTSDLQMSVLWPLWEAL